MSGPSHFVSLLFANEYPEEAHLEMAETTNEAFEIIAKEARKCKELNSLSAWCVCICMCSSFVCSPCFKG